MSKNFYDNEFTISIGDLIVTIFLIWLFFC